MTRGAVWVAGIGLLPYRALASDALDLALRGQNLIQKKAYADAVVLLLEAVRKDPSSDWALGLLGRAYHGLGEKREAVDAFRSALRINPADTYSRMMVDMLTQHPLPTRADTGRPLTSLEQAAREESRRMEKHVQVPDGLDYRVGRVVIDAGHGGFDSGAVGAGGLKEKEVTLDLALRLYRILERQGRVKPFLTRTGDYYLPLSARTVIANQYRADLFISIHINASKNRNARGSETYFCAEKASSAEARKVAAFENSVLSYDKQARNRTGDIDLEDILFKFERKNNWKESGRFASRFQRGFEEVLPLKSRGVHSANFFVLRKAKMPSILLETGFISNPAEESLLGRSAFRDRIAAAISRGLA
jgi:N-acetylmuramoyl-L-alanine amidase